MANNGGGQTAFVHTDPRNRDRVIEDSRRLGRQISALGKRWQDDPYQRELLNALSQRRSGRGIPQFQVLQDQTVDPALFVTGELIVGRDDADDPKIAALLQQYDFRGEPVECLDGRVVRLTNTSLDARRIADIAQLLRDRGVPASANHVSPLAPIAKGLGGPEPTTVDSGFSLTATDNGTPVKVAIIDTGIGEGAAHHDFLDGVQGDQDLLDDFPAGGDGFLDFGAGHGQFAAGIVRRVAAGADIHVYKALDSDGIGSEIDIACAMVRAAREGAQIINLSLGTETVGDYAPLGFQAALDILAEEFPDVLVVAAAGNSGSTRECWPAAFPSVVAVAGLTADLQPAGWSNRGNWVDCSTVAEGIVSTYVPGKESPQLDLDPDTFGPNPWAFWSGTSFGAPQVTGEIARRCQESKMRPADALRDLLSSPRRLPHFGVVLPILPGTSA